AVLYFDELSISYLQHLRLLKKIHAAGFTGIVPQSEVTQSDGYLRYETLVTQATNVIDDLRRILADGIASGKVKVAGAEEDNEANDARLKQHPTFAVLHTAEIADAVVVDDRYFNQHGYIQGDYGRKPLLTMCDLLPMLESDPAQQAEHLTTMRRAGLCLLAWSPAELISLI